MAALSGGTRAARPDTDLAAAHLTLVSRWEEKTERSKGSIWLSTFSIREEKVGDRVSFASLDTRRV